ncbi:hypothetical protein QKT49_gp312 [Acanthamoeba castellanii medusavirus]|uniref:Uncharacterized protein n=1 Tax=Acanthamoeba castellanii medusavirus J1 TaxID=3114988 RepID=A0A3T1CXA1_9VIRU|nr:hypothetical protein QKT49_gp312 [Acanthamoeba castellanii medusavirus]BBI30451.1 hypothetical protein [Acanthamoeba castellanii medusavirus J1]
MEQAAEYDEEATCELESCVWEEEDGITYAHLHDADTGTEFKLPLVPYDSLDQ